MKKNRIRIQALRREVKLRSKLSQIAIRKSEVAMTERMTANNGKYELLREQGATFATKEEVSIVTKIVYIGLGIVIAINALLKFIP